MRETPGRSSAEREFSAALMGSIDETIESLLGKRVIEALHEHLLHYHSISINETPDHLDILQSVFERTFGTSARTISKSVAKGLFLKLGLQFRPRGGMTLIEYVEEAKAKLGAVDA